MNKTFAAALFATTSMLASTVAQATELVATPSSPATSITQMGTNWSSGTGGKIIASGVVGTRAAISFVTPLQKAVRIRYSINIANRSAGTIQVAVGTPTMVSPTPSVPVTDGTNGETAIPDNFDSTLGTYTGTPVIAADNSGEEVGAFRFQCPEELYDTIDPMVLPGKPGQSHLHGFTGNDGVNAYSTYVSLRRAGSTKCGNSRYPLQRSAYWTPPMLNGNGAIVVPWEQQFYYKQIPNGNPVCNPPIVNGVPDLTGNYIGKCVPIPNGIRYLFGFNMGKMTGGLADAREAGNFKYECRKRSDPQTRDTTASGFYSSLDDMVDAGCPVGAVVYQNLQGPDCWDGKNVDVADHRSHVALSDVSNGQATVSWTWNGVAQTPTPMGKCPATHPYKIPTFAWQRYFITDITFVQKKWRLSSDDAMSMEMPHGYTSHMDYWEAWSPYWKNRWHTHCINEHRSCSVGEDGTGLSFYDPNRPANPMHSVAYNFGLNLKPLPRAGMSKPIGANGTFTGELTVLTGDSIYLYSPDGFTGEVTSWSMQTVTPVNVRSGVTHHTIP